MTASTKPLTDTLDHPNKPVTTAEMVLVVSKVEEMMMKALDIMATHAQALKKLSEEVQSLKDAQPRKRKKKSENSGKTISS